MRRAATVVVAVLTVCGASAADEESPRLELRSALKGTLLMTRSREVSALQPEEATAASLWRVRLEPRARPARWITVFAAYEQRVRVASSPGALSAAGLPPADTRGPFRVIALEGALFQGESLAYWHEVDRLAVSLHLPHVELTVGRQALGWGRGVTFGAVDLFAPFTPLELDREWRRGVDAVRAEVQLGRRASVEAVAVWGDALERSAFVGRARGFVGPVDAEVIGGWRARDVVLGGAMSAAVLGAAVHGELAAFILPEPWSQGGGRVVLKGVAGASYQLDVGEGLALALEYHSSGFGVAFPVDATALAADAALRARLARGDLQLLGRHAIAAAARTTMGTSVSLALQLLVDPIDGSGVLAPAITWEPVDLLALVGTAYVGWGALPRGLELRSQLGVTPITALVQVRLYDQRALRRSP